MTTSGFASLMRSAQDMLRREDDPLKSGWWRGYMRGLRRAHHGARFGTKTEHAIWLAAAGEADPYRAAEGRGYAAGLTGESRSPPDSDAERSARYKATGQQIACVLRDEAAIAGLEALKAEHGGVTAAVTAALAAFAKQPVKFKKS